MSENTRRANILFLITKSEVGGAQKYVKEQIDICVERFDVYLSTNEPDWLTESTEATVKALLLDKRIETRSSPGYLIRLLKFIRHNNIDLVIANSANGGLYGRIAAKLAGVPSIYVSHGWSSVYNGGKLAFLLNRVERYLAKISDKIICVSDNDYEVAKQRVRLPDKKLILIRNCIFPVKPEISLNKFFPENKLKLLSLARFAYPKRMDLLMAAMKGIDFADLYLIGRGPDEQIIRDYIAENGLRNIFLLGEIKDFNNFADYNVFILISDSEGLPMSALEAMSAGLPLVLSNVGGCKEVVVNQGLLVENSIEDIQRALFDLKENYHSYKLPVKDFFDTNFNLLLNKHKYLGLYSSLIK